MNCLGLCADCCGPVEGGRREMVRMARAGVRLPPRRDAVLQMLRNDGEYSCPALVAGRCSVYAARPAVCRVFGASVDMICPYGCRPAPGQRLLTSAETHAILDEARCVGTPHEPKPVAYFEELLSRPENAQRYRELLVAFTATQPIPPKRSR